VVSVQLKLIEQRSDVAQYELFVGGFRFVAHGVATLSHHVGLNTSRAPNESFGRRVVITFLSDNFAISIMQQRSRRFKTMGESPTFHRTSLLDPFGMGEFSASIVTYIYVALAGPRPIVASPRRCA
jgi:hypothetical protein